MASRFTQNNNAWWRYFAYSRKEHSLNRLGTSFGANAKRPLVEDDSEQSADSSNERQKLTTSTDSVMSDLQSAEPFPDEPELSLASQEPGATSRVANQPKQAKPCSTTAPASSTARQDGTKEHPIIPDPSSSSATLPTSGKSSGRGSGTTSKTSATQLKRVAEERSHSEVGVPDSRFESSYKDWSDFIDAKYKCCTSS